ncbi:MAG: hypothetical protein Q9211_004768 [Gyalolechia sp. 1 TL-2023]
MAFYHHQTLVLPQVIGALQQIEEPQRLASERHQRYSDPPPPYPSSGETTRPPSPGPPALSEIDRRWKRGLERNGSVPCEQFRNQTTREYRRLSRPFTHASPYDCSLDFLANADNNVRRRWVEQRIWKEGWGPPWPKGTKLYDRYRGGVAPGIRGPYPVGLWGHEKEPEPKFKSKPEPKPLPGRHLFGGLDTPLPEQSNVAAEGPAATAAESDTSASRPYYQFLFQISKEREFITDELQNPRIAAPVDIEAEAYKRVRDSWMEDKIWNPKWGEFPGMMWMHEDPDEQDHGPDFYTLPWMHEDPAERNKGRWFYAREVVDDRQPPDPAGISERRITPGLPRIFGPSPTPGNVAIDSNNLHSVPGGAEASGRESTRPIRRRETSGRRSTDSKSAEVPEEPIGRVFRGVRSSKVERRTKPRKSGFRGQGDRTIEATKMSNRPGRDGTSLEPGSDSINLSLAAPCMPRRNLRSGVARTASLPVRRSSRTVALNEARGVIVPTMPRRNLRPGATNAASLPQRRSSRTAARNEVSSATLRLSKPQGVTKSSSRGRLRARRVP